MSEKSEAIKSEISNLSKKEIEDIGSLCDDLLSAMEEEGEKT